MKYCIYLRPPQSVQPAFESIRNLFENRTLTYSKNEPHITLMVLYSNEKHRSRILNFVEGLNADFQSFLLEFKKFGFVEERRGVLRLVAKVKNSEPLQNLHEKVCRNLSGLIDWSTTPKPEERPDYHRSRKHAETHHQFGAPYYGKLYCPHCTIAIVSPELTFRELDERLGDVTLDEMTASVDEVVLRQKVDKIWIPV